MDKISAPEQTLERNLVTQGYALLDHNISTTAVDDLMGAYAEFTDGLPDPSLETTAKMIADSYQLDELNYSADQEPEWHKYRTNYPFAFKPGGYTNRSLQTKALKDVLGIKIDDDPKEYYHYLPGSTELIQQQHDKYGWGPIPPEVLKLQRKFSIIHELGRKLIRGALLQLEESYAGMNTAIVADYDLMRAPIRLLNYHHGQGDVLAGGHYDKSVLTAQLAESHEGLRIRHPQTGEMQPIRRSREKAAVFAGNLLTLPHVYPNADIQPGWHDVINVDKLNDGRSIQGKNVARWALIFFANSSYAGEVSKTLTHQELQKEELADVS
jgi:hypothetical protein